MADKDEFKFDDDDTFPDTDLSGAFSEGEQAAPDEPEYPMTIKKSGGSKTRLLLGLLVLVVAGGAAYYFLMMEEPPPPPKPPAKKAVVAPKPPPAPAAVASTPAAPAQPAAPAGSSAQVSVPPPPVKPAPAPAPAPAAVKPAVAPATVAVAPPPKPATPAAAAAPAQAKPAPAAAVQAPAKPVPAAMTPSPKPVSAPAPAAKPDVAKAAVPAVTGGPWLVEAGTYLNASALKAAEKKIRVLGYEPQVTTTQKSVRMTRLRLGSFPESEVKEALAYARGIAPDAFALRAGETFTVYAGTFTNPQNIRQMTQRLVSEGLPVEEEPIEVKRTISLVRFGGFADQATAAEVAGKARKAGIAAEVISPR